MKSYYLQHVLTQLYHHFFQAPHANVQFHLTMFQRESRSRNARRKSQPVNENQFFKKVKPKITLLFPSAGVWLASLSVALVREPQHVRMNGATSWLSATYLTIGCQKYEIQK